MYTLEVEFLIVCFVTMSNVQRYTNKIRNEIELT